MRCGRGGVRRIRRGGVGRRRGAMLRIHWGSTTEQGIRRVQRMVVGLVDVGEKTRWHLVRRMGVRARVRGVQMGRKGGALRRKRRESGGRRRGSRQIVLKGRLARGRLRAAHGDDRQRHRTEHQGMHSLTRVRMSISATEWVVRCGTALLRPHQAESSGKVLASGRFPCSNLRAIR
jgi:hypothetical protein